MALGEILKSHTTWNSITPKEVGHVSFILASFGFSIFGALLTNLKSQIEHQMSQISEQRLSQIQTTSESDQMFL